ncbi:GntR family transcriptional regulator [Peribacillus kribbensis]|uniref:GntR family transcriptional regulator n=1 Tax=Peribacillus kribbensis TaxID=356658 RepID=UPI000416631E|nr:GntR family transcriptional regulator [Peribacillus kribbensis]
MQVTLNTLQQEAIQNIRKLIIDGRLELGSRVNEVEVSNLLNMSRGPIRESLRILNLEGLVTYVPRKGMFVTKLERKDIQEIYDIRFYLEKNAVELGFHQVTHDMLHKLQDVVNQMETASKENRRDRLVQLDYQFHEVIITLPNYQRLKKNWDSYSALVDLIFAEVFRVGSERIEDIPQAHRILLDAFESGDKIHFIEILQKHYRDGKESLLSVWEERRAE